MIIKNSIQKQLFVTLGSLFLLTLVTTIIAVYIQTKEETNEIFSYQQEQISHLFLDTKSLSYSVSDFDDFQNGFMVIVYDKSNRQIFGPKRTTIVPPPKDGFVDMKINGEMHTVYGVTGLKNRVLVAQSNKKRDEIAYEASLTAIVPLLVLFPIFGLIFGLILKRGLRPLRVFESKISVFDENLLQKIDFGDMPVELKPLGEALNSMIVRINSSIDEKKTFLGDAAHELRTPLAALKLQLEVAQQYANNDEMRASLTRIESGVDRSSRLVNQLLSLAREESGINMPQRSDVNISQIVSQCIVSHYELAEAKNIELLANIEDMLFVNSDANDLVMIVNNLIDNAVRYTPYGGKVEIRLSKVNNELVFEVADSGLGIKDNLKQRIFDRFYRVVNDSSGSGLGLSIVKQICAKYGYVVSVNDNKPVGAIFRVKIPLKD